MNGAVKGLIAKCWKNEAVTLAPGKHSIDEVLTIRLTGTVVKQSDGTVAPTVSIPLIPTLALFWEKSGIARDHALRMLKESILEAMANGKNPDERIETRMKDIETAVTAIRQKLIAELPKMKRTGAVVTKGLQVEVLPVAAKTDVPKPKVAVA